MEATTVLRQENNPVIIEFIAKIETAIKESSEITVFTQSSVDDAAHFIKNFSTLEKKIETLRKETVEPYNQEVKSINQYFKSLIARFEPEKNRLETETKNWLRRQREIAEQKAREERRIAEEKAIQEAIVKEQKMREAGIEKPIVEVAIIPETVVRETKLSDSNSSGIGTMRIAKWEIIDFNLIPREFLIVDEKKVNALRKSMGVDAESTIQGIRFFYEETLVRR